MNHLSKGLLVAAGCIGIGLAIAVLSRSESSKVGEPTGNASLVMFNEPEMEEATEPPLAVAAPDDSPQELTDAWLQGTWGPVENNPNNNPDASCETDNVVTFSLDGSYRDGGSHGKFSTDGTTITYTERVLSDPAEGTEDRSQFDKPLVTEASAIDQNTLEEDGERLRRCSTN